MTPIPKYLILSLKIVIAGLSIFFIYNKVISRPDFDEMVFNINTTFLKKENVPNVILIFILMALNWFIESAKWKQLLNKIQSATWIQCIVSVLTGITVSVFTPNRVGEFAGRVLYIESSVRIKAAIASVIGSMNQLLVTIVAGSIGVLYSLNLISKNENVQLVLQFSVPVICLILIIFYFKISWLHNFTKRFESLNKISLYTKVFQLYSYTDLLLLSAMSIFRYFIFSFQFILMLEMFGIQADYFTLFKLISVIYLVMAIIPSIAISELTVRGSVALYFLSPLTGNSAGILAASSLLWLVNLVIPATIGALSVFYFRINNKRN